MSLEEWGLDKIWWIQPITLFVKFYQNGDLKLYWSNLITISGSFVHRRIENRAWWWVTTCIHTNIAHNDVIKWKHFPRYWPFVRGIHRSSVNSPHKGQWRGALMLSLICARINGWVNNGEAGDLRRHRAHFDVIVMRLSICYGLIHV